MILRLGIQGDLFEIHFGVLSWEMKESVQAFCSKAYMDRYWKICGVALDRPMASPFPQNLWIT